MRIKTRDLIRALEADGRRRVVPKGGHAQFKHPAKPGRVTIPYHRGGADIPAGTLRAIERQAGLALRTE